VCGAAYPDPMKTQKLRTCAQRMVTKYQKGQEVLCALWDTLLPFRVDAEICISTTYM
jgi:hypothetical protein